MTRTNETRSQQWAAVLPFLGLISFVHVAKIRKASPRANAHELQSNPYTVFTFFWMIRSLVDPTLAAFIVCGPLQILFVLELAPLRSGKH